MQHAGAQVIDFPERAAEGGETKVQLSRFSGEFLDRTYTCEITFSQSQALFEFGTIEIRTPNNEGAQTLRFRPVAMQRLHKRGGKSGDCRTVVRYETSAEDIDSLRTFHADLVEGNDGRFMLYFSIPRHRARSGRLYGHAQLDEAANRSIHDSSELLEKRIDLQRAMDRDNKVLRLKEKIRAQLQGRALPPNSEDPLSVSLPTQKQGRVTVTLLRNNLKSRIKKLEMHPERIQP